MNAERNDTACRNTSLVVKLKLLQHLPGMKQLPMQHESPVGRQKMLTSNCRTTFNRMLATYSAQLATSYDLSEYEVRIMFSITF